jgi:hypothetical protein
MLYYRVRRWPLWRVLLAQSLTIAVALVIELATVGQGRAIEWCSANTCKKPFRARPICTVEYLGYGIFDNGHGSPSFSDTMRAYIRDRENNLNPNRTVGRTELEILQLPINKEHDWIKRKVGSTFCACLSDSACLPIRPVCGLQGGGFIYDGQPHPNQQIYPGYYCNPLIVQEWEQHYSARRHPPRRRHGHRTFRSGHSK